MKIEGVKGVGVSIRFGSNLDKLFEKSNTIKITEVNYVLYAEGRQLTPYEIKNIEYLGLSVIFSGEFTGHKQPDISKLIPKRI